MELNEIKNNIGKKCQCYMLGDKTNGVISDIEGETVKITFDEQDFDNVIEIVKNRIKDKKRFELAVRAKEALQNVKDGKVKSGGFNELWSDLND